LTTSLKAGAIFEKPAQLASRRLKNQPQLLSWGLDEIKRNKAHSHSFKRERQMHEPQKEMMIKEN
jgi:hypothetical protein